MQDGFEVRIPSAGESITEVEVGEWLVKEGSWVDADQPIVVIETEKANMEIPAPAAGILTGVRLRTGDSAAPGDLLATIVAGTRPEGASPVASGRETLAAAKPAGHVMPAASRALAEANLRAEDVAGTGPRGRLLKEDVQRHLAALEKTAEAPAAPQPAGQPSVEPPVDELPSVLGQRRRPEERIRMSLLRRTIARRLVEAQQTAALLTTFNEIDMSGVLALRRRHQDDFVRRYGVKLGLMSFFVKASVEALKAFPALNARIEEDEIVYQGFFDIGVAVGGGKGLVVPVIRNAEAMSFAQVELQIAEYAKKAQDGQLELADLQGGTFTISNGGVYGSLLSTPIVNPPQSGILGMHAIQDRPIAVDGQVVIRPMMYVALTYDHRLIDGREAVTFLRTIKQCVEDPTRILLEV